MKRVAHGEQDKPFTVKSPADAGIFLLKLDVDVAHQATTGSPVRSVVLAEPYRVYRRRIL